MNPNIKRLLVVAMVPAILSSCSKENLTTDPTTKPDLEVVETAPPVQTAVNKKISDNIPGLYQSLPARYDSTTKKYPLMVFMHGAGEKGTGGDALTKVLKNSVPKLIKEEKFPASFRVKEENHSFIVVSPQTIGNSTAADVITTIDYAVNTLRVDEERVYVIGLSMGGGVAWDVAANYGDRVAAIAPICGGTSATEAKAKKIADNNVAVWAFHNEDDATVKVKVTNDFISYLNAQNPAIAPKATIWPTGGHDSWTKASNPALNVDGLNVYEWMLQYKKAKK